MFQVPGEKYTASRFPSLLEGNERNEKHIPRAAARRRQGQGAFSGRNGSDEIRMSSPAEAAASRRPSSTPAMSLPSHLSFSSSTGSATSPFSHVACQIENLPSQMAQQITSCERGGSCAQSQGLGDIDGGHGTATHHHQELGTTKSTPRAKWTHQMKLFLIELLKDHDVPGFLIQNAWSKEAWKNIVCRLNQKFCVSFSINEVKQKEQDFKKEYRSVKKLMAESGFEWDGERMMVKAPPNVWANFVASKNNKDALQWRDKSLPYFDDLASLYDGRYANIYI